MKSLLRPMLGKRLFKRLLRPRAASLVVARKAMPGYTRLVRPLVWHTLRPVHAAPTDDAGQADSAQSDWVPDDGLSAILRGHQENQPADTSTPSPVQRSSARTDQPAPQPSPSPRSEQPARLVPQTPPRPVTNRPAEVRVQRAPTPEPPRPQPVSTDSDDTADRIPAFLRGKSQPTASPPKTPAPAQPKPIQRTPGSEPPAEEDMTGKTQPLRVQRKAAKPVVKSAVEEIKRPGPQKDAEQPTLPPAVPPVQRAAEQDAPKQMLAPRPEQPKTPAEPPELVAEPPAAQEPEASASPEITQEAAKPLPAKPQPAVDLPLEPTIREEGSGQGDINPITNPLIDSLAKTRPVRRSPEPPPQGPAPIVDLDEPTPTLDSYSQPTVRVSRPQPRIEPPHNPPVEEPPASQQMDTPPANQITTAPALPAVPEPKPLAAAKPLIMAQPLRAAKPLGQVQRKEAPSTDPLAFWSSPQRRELPLATAMRTGPGAMPTSGPSLPLSSVVQRATQNSNVTQSVTPPSGRPGSLSTPQGGGSAAPSEPAVQNEPGQNMQAASQPAEGQQPGNQSSAAPSLDEMARQVYSLLRRRLQVEQERARGRS